MKGTYNNHVNHVLECLRAFKRNNSGFLPTAPELAEFANLSISTIRRVLHIALVKGLVMQMGVSLQTTAKTWDVVESND